MLGDRVFSRELWRPRKQTVAAGVATGLFWAMMPIPFQMLPAGVMAFFLRFNVPAAISVVWITNPLTWPVILYWQYRLGSWLLGQEVPELTSMEMLTSLTEVPIPLLLGCIVCGGVIAPVSYGLVLVLWSTVAERWWRSHARPDSREVPAG